MIDFNNLPTPDIVQVKNSLLEAANAIHKPDLTTPSHDWEETLKELKKNDIDILKIIHYLLTPFFKQISKPYWTYKTTVRNVVYDKFIQYATTVRNVVYDKFIQYANELLETNPKTITDILVIIYVSVAPHWEKIPQKLISSIAKHFPEAEKNIEKYYIESLKKIIRNSYSSLLEDTFKELNDVQKSVLIKKVIVNAKRHLTFKIEVTPGVIEELLKTKNTTTIKSIISMPSNFILINSKDILDKISVLAINDDEFKETIKKSLGNFCSQLKIYTQFIKRYIKFSTQVEDNNLLKEYYLPSYSIDFIDIRRMIQENPKITNEIVVGLIKALSDMADKYKIMTLEKWIKLIEKIVPIETISINVIDNN